MLAEIVVTTTRFDSEAFVGQGAWWASALVYARYLPQGLVAIGAAAVVFARPSLRSNFPAPDRQTADETTPSHRWPLFLALHFVVFGAFLGLTTVIWEGPLGESIAAPAWIALWFATGLTASAALLAVALPPTSWLTLAKKSSGKLPIILAFAIAACVAGRLTGLLLVPLHAATFRLVETFLRLGFPDITSDRDEHWIGTSDFVVAIAPECSGYEGIGLIWVFLTAYLWLFRRDLRFPSAFWLFPLGTLVIWLANALRITALIVIGAKFSKNVAIGGFHSQAGWLAFNAVALGLVVLSRKARLFAHHRETEGEIATEIETASKTIDPTTAYLAPLLTLVGTMMLTAAFSASQGFDYSYPLRVLTVAFTIWLCRRGYPGLQMAATWQAVALGLFVFVVWLALESYYQSSSVAHNTSQSEFLEKFRQLPPWFQVFWLIARVFGSVITVPIAEELAFRGYLSRRLLDRDFTSVPPGRFTVVSFVVSSVLFGIFHGRYFAGTIAGMAYAYAYRRKGNLNEAIVAHATTNALIAADVLMTGAWSLWL